MPRTAPAAAVPNESRPARRGALSGAASAGRPWTRRCVGLAALATLFAASGASCPSFFQQYAQPLRPRVLPQTPTLDNVMAVVNENSARVHSLRTTNSVIYIPGAPKLQANLALDRPRRFRLRADSTVFGSRPEVDLGSNDELIWLWIRAAPPPAAMYYVRHEQYHSSPAQRLFPVEPEWLIDAIGLPTLDPALPHKLTEAGNGRLRVETIVQTPVGPSQRVTIVDDAQGYVLEQQVYDATGRLIAIATASKHERDPLYGAVLPRKIHIQWPATSFEFTIEMRSIALNESLRDLADLWALPEYPEYPPVDIASPNFRFPGPPIDAMQPLPPAYPAAPAIDASGQPATARWYDRFRFFR